MLRTAIQKGLLSILCCGKPFRATVVEGDGAAVVGASRRHHPSKRPTSAPRRDGHAQDPDRESKSEIGIVANLGISIGIIANLGIPIGIIAKLGIPIGIIAKLGIPRLAMSGFLADVGTQ